MTSVYDFMTGALRALTLKGDLLVRKAVGTDRLAAGADGQVLSANANDALGLTWQAAGLANPGYVSGRWYTGLSGGAFSTTTSSSSGTTLYVMPIYIAKRTTFTDIGVWVTSVGTATAMHLGIYSGTPVSGQSLTLVSGSDVTVSSLSAGASNGGAFASAITLDKGWYGLALFANGSVTTNCLATGVTGYLSGHSDLNTAGPKLGATGQTYGALPSPLTLAVTNEGSTSFAVGLKAQ